MNIVERQFMYRCRLLAQQSLPHQHYLLQLKNEALATHLRPGHWVKFLLDPNPLQLPVIRKLPASGEWQVLAAPACGPMPTDWPLEVSCDGPLGEAAVLDHIADHHIILCQDHHLAEGIFLAEHLRSTPHSLLLIAELQQPAFFQPRPSQYIVPGQPAGAIACVPLLEDWQIPSRIACPEYSLPGCYAGSAAELLGAILRARTGKSHITIFGPAAFAQKIRKTALSIN